MQKKIAGIYLKAEPKMTLNMYTYNWQVCVDNSGMSAKQQQQQQQWKKEQKFKSCKDANDLLCKRFLQMLNRNMYQVSHIQEILVQNTWKVSANKKYLCKTEVSINENMKDPNWGWTRA